MAGEPEDKNALIERIGKIRGVIENDELDEAVSLLKVVTTDSRLEMHSADVLQVAARITELHKSRIGDVISRDDEVKESNRIRRSMISLCQLMEDSVKGHGTLIPGRSGCKVVVSVALTLMIAVTVGLFLAPPPMMVITNDYVECKDISSIEMAAKMDGASILNEAVDRFLKEKNEGTYDIVVVVETKTLTESLVVADFELYADISGVKMRAVAVIENTSDGSESEYIEIIETGGMMQQQQASESSVFMRAKRIGVSQRLRSVVAVKFPNVEGNEAFSEPVLLKVLRKKLCISHPPRVQGAASKL